MVGNLRNGNFVRSLWLSSRTCVPRWPAAYRIALLHERRCANLSRNVIRSRPARLEGPQVTLELAQHRRIGIVSDDVSAISVMVQKLETLPRDRALLVGVSGIDGSGKGYITARLDQQLRELGHSVAAISADDWLNLPPVGIDSKNPGEHFYERALRLDQMFTELILPLRAQRRLTLVADCADAKATVHRQQQYSFSEIDIILLEGIFLFKPAYRDHFDLKVWIECSFERALQRALTRQQEGLSQADTIQAYEKIYFSAQRIHLERDQPAKAADIVLPND